MKVDTAKLYPRLLRAAHKMFTRKQPTVHGPALVISDIVVMTSRWETWLKWKTR